MNMKSNNATLFSWWLCFYVSLQWKYATGYTILPAVPIRQQQYQQPITSTTNANGIGIDTHKNTSIGGFVTCVPTARTRTHTLTRLSMMVVKPNRLGSSYHHPTCTRTGSLTSSTGIESSLSLSTSTSTPAFSPLVLFSKKGTYDDEDDERGNGNGITTPDEEDTSYEERMDLGGFAGYLGPYVAAVLLSIGVTAAFVKFVLLDY